MMLCVVTHIGYGDRLIVYNYGQVLMSGIQFSIYASIFWVRIFFFGGLAIIYL